MKGSTAGARHLAVSANWVAWQVSRECPGLLGNRMETALAHWTRDRFADFLQWRRSLPC